MNEHPSFPKTLPLSKKTVRIRPMIVKDEKILMMVGNTAADRLDHLKQVLQNCVTGVENFDNLSFIDFQFLFMMVRATSIDDVVTVIHEQNGKSYNADITLSKPKFKNLEAFAKNNTLKITETSGIKFKSPTFADVYRLADTPMDPNDTTRMIVQSIDCIFFGDKVHDASNTTEEEMIEMFDSFPAKTLREITKIFKTLPYMYYDSEIELDDGTKQVVEVTNFTDFF